MNRPDTDAKRHHAAAMFKWEKQIATDVALGRHRLAAAGISVILRDKMRHSGETPPIDQKWIANQGGRSVRTVQRVLDALVKCGHLETTCGKSRGVANLYRAIIKEKAKSQPVGYDSGVVGGTTPESEGGTTRESYKNYMSSSYPSSWKRPHGTVGERGGAAGSARKQAGQVSEHLTPYVAEQLVSKVLGPHGYEILEALQETEDGRGIYDQLIRFTKAGQTGKPRMQLLERAQRHFLDWRRRAASG